MENEEKIDDELDKISAGFPKPKAVNDIPEGYFEELPDRIMSRMAKETTAPKTRRINWMTSLAAAAVLTGLVLASSLVFFKNDLPIEPISAQEAYQYIEENMHDFEYLLEDEYITLLEYQMDLDPEIIEEYLLDELYGDDPENYFE